MTRSSVVYEDWGLGTLEKDTARLLEDVLDTSASAVERKMKRNIIERDYVDTRATVNSVQVDPVKKKLERDIGPTTHYALLGELGWLQTHVYGNKLKEAIHHPGLPFARDALESVRGPFKRAVGAALKKLGGKRRR